MGHQYRLQQYSIKMRGLLILLFLGGVLSRSVPRHVWRLGGAGGEDVGYEKPQFEQPDDGVEPEMGERPMVQPRNMGPPPAPVPMPMSMDDDADSMRPEMEVEAVAAHASMETAPANHR